MSVIQNLAWILIVISLIKIIVLAISPKSWMNFAKMIWNNGKVMKWVFLILAAVVLYYLIGAGFTVVQILAVSLFTALMLAVGLAGDVDVLIKKYELRIKQGKLWSRYWLYTLLWLILLAWGIKELLAL